MKKIILFLSFIFIALFSFAQIQISGNITSEEGGVLPAVNVMIKNHNTGTTTDMNGDYKITVENKTNTLVFSFIGFETQEIIVSNNTIINVKMAISSIDLDKVVVTASRKKEKLLEAPASIAVISAKEIEGNVSLQPIDNIEEVSGIDVSRTGLTSSNVASRGFNNVFSGSLLTMVDNRVASVPSLRVNSSQLIPGNSDDIASIEVLKGPASAIYGPFSSNGVMHILTKSPFNIDGKSETKVSFGIGERDVTSTSVRHSTKLSDKLAFKISVNRIQGNDWEYIDQAEIEAAADFAGATGKDSSYIYLHIQNPDSTGGRYWTGDSVSVVRDNSINNWNIDGRVDYKINNKSKIILAAGHSVINGIELTGLGAGQGINWSYDYYQARYMNNNFFAQVYKNISNAGDSYLRRTGDLLVDKSEFISYQAQNTSNVGELTLTYGIDAFLTRPNTEGTINGQFEDDDNIDEIGYYVQGKWALNDKVDIIGAIRSDEHTWVEGNQISPRMAFIYKASPQSTFRATYNKAFESPSALNSSLDIMAGTLPTGIGVIGRGNRNGLTFSRDDVSGVLQYAMPSYGALDLLFSENFYNLNDPMASNVPFYLVQNGLIEQIAIANGGDSLAFASAAAMVNEIFPNPLMGLSNTLMILNLDEETSATQPFISVDPENIVDIKAIKNSVNETKEIGYKGMISDHLSVSVDVWKTEYKDFISPLTVQTPNVFVDPTSAFMALSDPNAINTSSPYYSGLLFILDDVAMGGNGDGSIVDEMTALIAQIPYGTVTPHEDANILMTYANFGDVEVSGVDISGTFYISNKTKIGGSASFVDKDQFETEEGYTVALNAPKKKYNISFRTELMEGLQLGLTHRWQADFPINSGVYVGNLPELRTTDINIGYQIAPTSRIDLSVKNVKDEKQQYFVGAPEMGRLMLLRVSHTF